VSERSFEGDQAELETIVDRLERGDVALEELARLYERGEELWRRLAAELEQTQGRIEELGRKLDADSADSQK
jgi:exodeoxyribonuclease VII small subunit